MFIIAMLSRYVVLSTVHLLVAVSVLQAAVVLSPKGIVQGPENEAVMVGDTQTFTCRVELTGSERIQWEEFGTDPNGALISDNNVLLPGHPNFLRYSLIHDTLDQYDLVITDTRLTDGTYYKCSDINEVPPNVVTIGAQLVMIEAAPNCSTTLPANGIVLEGEYHTAECIMTFHASAGVEPLMTWSGPEPFVDAHTITNVTVWSGISFTIDRSMDARAYECLSNFTDKGFNSPDSATNIPTTSHTYRTQQILVHWGPKNMYSSPVYTNYQVGQTITCFADAFPMADIYWQSLRTNEFWYSVSFTVREDMVGNQTMRCHAENFINNILYYQDLFVVVNVLPPPTTPTPGVSTTTTAPPPESDCFDLTGRWEATNPSAVMCIWIDHEHNGVLMGLFKNGTDTYYADIYGRAQVNTWDQGGFSAIWPGELGVSAHVLECRRCYGTETMTVSQQIRSEASAAFCGDVGVTNYLPNFVFFRVAVEPPCDSSPPQL